MDRHTRTGALALVAAVVTLFVSTASVGAATTGQICGEVEDFTATTSADGTITINGNEETVLAGAVSAATAAQLAAIAALDGFTCINVVADTGGDITELSLAAEAELCGRVVESAGAFLVNDIALTADLVTLIDGDATLAALLDAAAGGGGSVCLDLAFSSAGLVTSVNLDANLHLCGNVTLDADSATVAGVDVPLTLLSADAAAALAVAVDADVDVCVDVTVENTDVVDAAVDATIELCGSITLNADGSAVVDGVTIPAELIGADLAAALELAADADADGCVTVNAVSAGGDTTVTLVVDVSLCAVVEAITANSITVGGVTFPTSADLTAEIEVGDRICFDLATAPGGDVVIAPGTITEPDGTPIGPGDEGAAPGAEENGGGALPDTAMPAAPGHDGGGAALLVALLGLATAACVREVVRARVQG